MDVALATSLGLASSLPSTEPLAFSWLLLNPLHPPVLSFDSLPKPVGPALVTVCALIIVVPTSGSSHILQVMGTWWLASTWGGWNEGDLCLVGTGPGDRGRSWKNEWRRLRSSWFRGSDSAGFWHQVLSIHSWSWATHSHNTHIHIPPIIVASFPENVCVCVHSHAHTVATSLRDRFLPLTSQFHQGL